MSEQDLLERFENAAAALLIEIAFLLPRGTNLKKHPISRTLKEFQEALIAVSVSALKQERDRLEKVIRKVCDGMTFDPLTRTYQVTEQDWFNQPYTAQTPDDMFRAALKSIAELEQGRAYIARDIAAEALAAGEGS